MKITFIKKGVENYIDKVLDICVDSYIGVPDKIYEYDDIINFIKENDLELDYVFMGLHMYDNGIDFYKEIKKYVKKHKASYREACYQLFSLYYNEWKECDK